MDNRENYRLQFFDRTTRGLFAAQICDIDDSEITIRFTHPDLAGLQELLLGECCSTRITVRTIRSALRRRKTFLTHCGPVTRPKSFRKETHATESNSM
jgi:hypothetical protein